MRVHYRRQGLFNVNDSYKKRVPDSEIVAPMPVLKPQSSFSNSLSAHKACWHKKVDPSKLIQNYFCDWAEFMLYWDVFRKQLDTFPLSTSVDNSWSNKRNQSIYYKVNSWCSREKVFSLFMTYAFHTSVMSSFYVPVIRPPGLSTIV